MSIAVLSAGILAMSMPLRKSSPPTTHCMWQTVDAGCVRPVMQRYFSVNVSSTCMAASADPLLCDLFLIEGVPAAAMLYRRRDDNAPQTLKAEAFHLNWAMLLLFDAGERMRRLLYCRYRRRVAVEDALNVHDFLSCR